MNFAGDVRWWEQEAELESEALVDVDGIGTRYIEMVFSHPDVESDDPELQPVSLYFSLN